MYIAWSLQLIGPKSTHQLPEAFVFDERHLLPRTEPRKGYYISSLVYAILIVDASLPERQPIYRYTKHGGNGPRHSAVLRQLHGRIVEGRRENLGRDSSRKLTKLSWCTLEFEIGFRILHRETISDPKIGPIREAAILFWALLWSLAFGFLGCYWIICLGRVFQTQVCRVYEKQ